MNSDNICDINLCFMKEKFMESNAIDTILAYEVQDPSKFCLIEAEGDEIKSF